MWTAHNRGLEMADKRCSGDARACGGLSACLLMVYSVAREKYVKAYLQPLWDEATSKKLKVDQ